MSGCTLSFPVEASPGLAELTPEQLARVEVTTRGAALRWEERDVDLSVPGMVAHLLHLEQWAPRLLGSRTSAAKARASRENGRKGGRPRKKDRAR